MAKTVLNMPHTTKSYPLTMEDIKGWFSRNKIRCNKCYFFRRGFERMGGECVGQKLAGCVQSARIEVPYNHFCSKFKPH